MVELVNIKNHYDKIKKIEIGHHHVALEIHDLESWAVDLYQRSFDEARSLIVEELKLVLKDETLKALVVDRNLSIEDSYSYLNGK